MSSACTSSLLHRAHHPLLRDSPHPRRRAAAGRDRGQQIVASVAEMIPLSKQGSMLRAISHNQAQTAILGVNRPTTGLFRALNTTPKAMPESEREGLMAERILPRLPVRHPPHPAPVSGLARRHPAPHRNRLPGLVTPPSSPCAKTTTPCCAICRSFSRNSCGGTA